MATDVTTSFPDTVHVCATCGAEFPEPSSRCKICDDDRQFVAGGGQKWVSKGVLLKEHKNILREEEPGVLGIGTEPTFAIGQRALLIQTGTVPILRNASGRDPGPEIIC